ncbi:MAG TPA: glycosyltransferase family 9 protein [Bryobacteraceae bacterium]|nr:glycosyltransferase family 9 protein [Bryobacteraceae bacterium]
MNAAHVLVVRLGSMGDVIAALPAVASLKQSMPHSRITWLIEPKWRVLLEGNSSVDSVITFDRRNLQGWRGVWRALRAEHFDIAVDFQGLVKSAILASVARPERIFGFTGDYARERPASWFYSDKVAIRAYHAVERNLDLAASAGASTIVRVFPLPRGEPEGELPQGNFILASPLAGWGAKQWPLEYYEELAEGVQRNFGFSLVLNAPVPMEVKGAWLHVSGIPGLIDATRKATAVVGIDSGPTHLAAALGKPGVAIYGPTEPARHGPYGDTFSVLRARDAVTTYRRTAEPDSSMRAITPRRVLEALTAKLGTSAKRMTH